MIVSCVYSCKCIPAKVGEEVCGSDGKTYESGCYLFCMGIYRNENEPCLTKVSDGACSSPECICSDPCNHVCGSNGQTYGNDCTLKCAQNQNPDLKKVKDGKCGDCICTDDYNPVCGSDGVTYSNPCALKCQQEKNLGLTKAFDGRCTGDE